MIIYGSRATQLANESIPEPCPHCQNSNTMNVYVFQRYAHIFWIPFVPIGKTGASQCSHCKQVLKLKQMPGPLRLAYDNVALRTKIPFWTFIGAGLVALVFLIAVLKSM